MEKEWDIVIVGMGTAGMFAAHTLLEGRKDLNILIVERGRSVVDRRCVSLESGGCVQCSVCDIMCGEGGAGVFSDGTLNLRYDIGGDISRYTSTQGKAKELIEEVDRVFQNYGAPEELANPDNDLAVVKLMERAAAVGIRFINIPQRHIGSDKAPALLQKFSDDLTEKGVSILLNEKVEDIMVVDGECRGIILKNKRRKIFARATLMCPGRGGIEWIEKIIKKHTISATYGPIDVGVRVEVPAIIMERIISTNRDPKFHIHTKKYDDFIRTFCTNSHGFVVKECYHDFVGVNGHSHKEISSDNTNFAFLMRIELTKPIENTTKYGRSIAKLATTIGGGNPIVQRIGDLKRGRRTTEKRLDRGPIRNTLKSVTPGDISMALPHRIVTNIIEGLDKLNEVIPGVMSDSTLLYAPEIKFYSMITQVDNNMQTSVHGLHAAGDGMGLSGDIVNSAATGILAGKGILKVLDNRQIDG